MSVRDLTSNDLLLAVIAAINGAPLEPGHISELRRRLLAGEEAERERDRLAEQVEKPWTDAVLVEKVAQGLFCAAANGSGLPIPDWMRVHWFNEARRVLGEPSEATKLDDGEFGKAVARGGALRLRGSLHGEPS